jgi:hypothetical protein
VPVGIDRIACDQHMPALASGPGLEHQPVRGSGEEIHPVTRIVA